MKRRFFNAHPVKPTGDPEFDLLAGVYRMAISDAHRGDEEAIDFLNTTAPDWRELQKRAKQVDDRTRVSRPQGRAGRTQQRAPLHTG